MLWATLASDIEREAFIAELIELYTDPDFITQHPALIYKSLDGAATLTASADADDVEAAATMASIVETGDYSSSEFTFDRQTWSVALRYLQYEMTTDLASSAGGRLDASRLAMGFVKSAAHTMTGLLATAGSTFSATFKDASAAALTGEDLFTALDAFATATGRRAGLCVIHPTAARDLRSDSLFVQASNAAVTAEELAALRKFAGDTVVGVVGGCTIMQSAQVPVVSSKRAGFITARGGLGLADKTPVAQDARHQILGKIRTLAAASDEGPSGVARAEIYLGAGIVIDDLGGKFLTKSY